MRLISITRCHCSVSISSAGLALAIPAALTAISERRSVLASALRQREDRSAGAHPRYKELRRLSLQCVTQRFRSSPVFANPVADRRRARAAKSQAISGHALPRQWHSDATAG